MPCTPVGPSGNVSAPALDNRSTPGHLELYPDYFCRREDNLTIGCENTNDRFSESVFGTFDRSLKRNEGCSREAASALAHAARMKSFATGDAVRHRKALDAPRYDAVRAMLSDFDGAPFADYTFTPPEDFVVVDAPPQPSRTSSEANALLAPAYNFL